jgi:DNA-binding NtrC family response regulator
VRVLVVDDQPDVREALRLLFKSEDIDVVCAEGPDAAVAAIETWELDAVLADLNFTRDTTSGREGLDLLSRTQAIDPALPVVVLTGWGSVEGAVEAMRRGARDYVVKPWDNVRLLSTVRAQAELRCALRRAKRLEREGARARRRELPAFIAESRTMQPVLRLIERIGPSDANVLVTGEHGTGKEVVARLLHESSGRREQSFVPVNAGGLPEGVFESELFGHVRGAFTDAKSERTGCLELADGGTLFLDEITNMPLGQQAKLLRVLQSGELAPVGSSRTRCVSVRIVSAANVDVKAEVGAGRFREDLLYRLNTVEIQLPPLRDRPEDILPLATHFLEIHARHYQVETPRLSDDALRAVRAHPFPGNVRELGHAMERALLLAHNGVITRADLGLGARDDARRTAVESMTLEAAERYLVMHALERHAGNVSETARSLGLSRSALYRRLQTFGIK